MTNFQPITEELLEFVLEIVNSNSDYNILENGNPLRTIEEVRSEFLNETTDSYLIILENKYVGIIDFLKNNPKDNHPWIGLLMIHGDDHYRGYGKKAYVLFEEILKQQKTDKIRIGILQKNSSAKAYWTSLGFKFYDNRRWEGKLIECFERQLT
ncbi:GCN5-related N-acetyltransferase [Alkaliphilus metalliredigens QYMF]|uniref:GCN5-related N-acetyltransferase n=1 Tax=Alkaliphilus metalliredigens (strain QYMF) TaxID=293826 RepID=A6TPP4_ALKMQ|nr:GNAT family N-acetyltransferase [Alkaliphilus metalliredigens]ABR48162.1 GCN5-related N-acetyltransferase [Alkaliphilus metalliredigens QYMF]